MITKSEEEHIMEEAIASKIADYLIKPLNPNQILLSVKKILENKRLVTEKTNLNYQQQFQEISMAVNDYLNYREWAEIYQKLVYWELEFESPQNRQMKEILEMQKMEANLNFMKYVKDNYEYWLESDTRRSADPFPSTFEGKSIPPVEGQQAHLFYHHR